MKMDFNWRNAAAKYVQLMEWYEPHVCLWSFGIGMCVACLSLRVVIHRTIGQGCNRSASFRALALQLIERPTTLHQDKRCDLLMFIFLLTKPLYGGKAMWATRRCAGLAWMHPGGCAQLNMMDTNIHACTSMTAE